MDAAIKRLPFLETAGRATHWAGLYEVTPDAHPIMGAIARGVTRIGHHDFMETIWKLDPSRG